MGDSEGWTVAYERPARRVTGTVVSLVLFVALAAGIGGYLLARGWLDGSGRSVNQTIHAPLSTSTRPLPATSDPASTTPATDGVVMPDLVCMDHQDAQNKLQAIGLRNMGEIDGTGQGRLLIIDHNWVVIKQSVSPGLRVPTSTKVILTSVKDNEAKDYGC